MEIGKAYLNSMYVSRDFDSASKMWDRDVIVESRRYYSKKEGINVDDSSAMRLIKDAYLNYYQQLIDFKVSYLAIYSFGNMIGDSIEVKLLYHCDERVKKKPKDIRINLYFVSRDKGQNWMLLDSKEIDITNHFSKP